MVDLSEFDALANNKPTRCIVARVVDELNEEDREKFDAAWGLYGDSTISKWLRSRQLKAGAQAVRKHRNGECCCA